MDNGRRGKSGAWAAVTLAGAAAAAAVTGFVAGGGCYNPNVSPGGLRCAPTGKACPDGFVCTNGVCATRDGVGAGGVTGSGGAGNGSGGTPGSGGAGTGGAPGSGGMSGTGGAAACVMPRDNCTAMAMNGACDPYCRSGCADCHDKCLVNTQGNAVCAPAPRNGRQELQTCSIMNRGQPNQSDDCAAGLVCLDDCANTSHCFKFCRNDNDCPQSSCSRAIPSSSQMVCDVPFTQPQCNPATLGGGCSRTGDACYLIASGRQTVCDCPHGAGSEQSPCSDSRDCLAGLTCPDNGPGAGYCRAVCDPNSVPTGCVVGTCRQYGDWGYCF